MEVFISFEALSVSIVGNIEPVTFKNLLKYWLLTDLFQTLLSWSRTHLHIAVVHDTARNICIISFRAFKIMQIRGLVFNSTTMILFTLLYPLFISCYCFSSIFYVQRIINKCLYIIWSLECMFCQIFWAGELSSSWYISPCIVPGTSTEEIPEPV